MTKLKKFYIDIPLYTAMRISVERPESFNKEDLFASVTRNELAECQLLTGWQCVKDSWEQFLDSDEDSIEFIEGEPPRCLILEALGL